MYCGCGFSRFVGILIFKALYSASHLLCVYELPMPEVSLR